MTAIPIVALDVEGAREALALAARLGASCRNYKVGSELFTSAGPDVVRALREMGTEVFLDLKLHDIPNTVHGAAQAAARLGASLLTVHASGGVEMMRAAVEGGGASCGILAVTILTSFDAEGIAAAWGRAEGVSVAPEVIRLAEGAALAGAHGVVCSGEEVALVRERFGDQLSPLVPGIRFADGASHDQRRVVTPAAAVQRGARYVVVGRAVTAAADPAGAMARVWEAMRSVALGSAELGG
ncbi:MAG: orotidine-5'-phosphate decarboxylase [Gemmatimonadota bacterium]